MKKILIYDGTFDGFLTAVYSVFDAQLKNVEIVKPKHYQPNIFIESEELVTDRKKAKRVWHGLQLKVTKSIANKLHASFLSEIKGVENVLLRFILTAYSSESFMHTDYENKDILRVAQVSKMVFRERNRMEAVVKFQLTKDGIYFADIEPDFNVLPLFVSHFKKKFGDQKWMIYDRKRKYAAYFDLREVHFIDIDLLEATVKKNNNLEYLVAQRLFESRNSWAGPENNTMERPFVKEPRQNYA